MGADVGEVDEGHVDGEGMVARRPCKGGRSVAEMGSSCVSSNGSVSTLMALYLIRIDGQCNTAIIKISMHVSEVSNSPYLPNPSSTWLSHPAL